MQYIYYMTEELLWIDHKIIIANIHISKDNVVMGLFEGKLTQSMAYETGIRQGDSLII